MAFHVLISFSFDENTLSLGGICCFLTIIKLTSISPATIIRPGIIADINILGILRFIVDPYTIMPTLGGMIGPSAPPAATSPAEVSSR